MAEKVETELQVAEPAATVEAGAETPQSTPAPAEDAQPGAEPKAEVTTEGAKPAAKSGKVYTEEEVRARENSISAKLQKEAEGYRAANEQLLMERQLVAMQAQEHQAQAKDRQDIDAGVITEEQAGTNQRMRAEQAQLLSLRRQVRGEAESNARVIVIKNIVADLNKEYDVSLNEGDFLGDNTLVSPDLVTNKALKLINARLKSDLRATKLKSEEFDKGPGEGKPGSATEEQNLRARYPTMFHK